MGEKKTMANSRESKERKCNHNMLIGLAMNTATHTVSHDNMNKDSDLSKQRGIDNVRNGGKRNNTCNSVNAFLL